MSDKGEFAELLWENGQAVLHGRKPHIPVAPFPPFAYSNVGSSRAQEKHGGAGGGGGGGEFAMLPKTSAFGSLEMAAVQDDGDDDAVPWIHYPVIDDVEDTAPLPADYCSELLSELLPPMTPANLGSMASSSHHTTTNRSTHIPSKESQSAHVQTAPPPVPVSKQPRPSGGGGTVMNFSLFSRPAALARATLQRPPQGDDKAPAPTATSSNPVESTVVQTTSRLRSTPLFTDQRMAWFQPPKDQRLAPAAAPPPPAAPTQEQETAGNGDTPNPRTSQRPQPEERAHEAPVTSSVCSGNGAVDDDRLRQLKLRTRAECSASQDEDMDDDLGAPRRTSATRSTKRSRTAEVHNLSERRRRDRINEKMRALQELIPNCNKIDKASMLDEAIEYLKTLQLQVQMMSLGGGLCMPPMLLPPHLQHLQLPPMAHFPHLGMGLGYGMGGAFDLAAAGGGAPMLPLTPPIPGAQFPCPMVPAPTLGMPGSAAMPMFAAAQLVGMPYRDAHLFPQASAAMAHMVQEQMHSLAPNQQQLQQQQEANAGDSHIATIPHGDQK